MKSSDSSGSASALIDERIEELGGWRGETLAKLRKIILKADSAIVEEWKWGTPVWSREGIVCTGEAYKKAVKMTFAKGAALSDPSRLFNSSLEGNVRRAIDVQEGEKINEAALKDLIREAVAHNLSGKSKKGAPAGAKAKAPKKVSSPKTTKVKAAAPAKTEKKPKTKPKAAAKAKTRSKA